MGVGIGVVAIVMAGAVAANAAATTYSLVDLTQGADVLVSGDVHVTGNESEGSVAAGGDLSFDGFRLQVHYSSAEDQHFLSYDGKPLSVLLGGTVNLGSSSGTMPVLNGGYVRVGDTTEIAMQIEAPGSQNRAVNTVGSSYSEEPRIAVNSSGQDPATLGAPGLFDELFGDVFEQFEAMSTCLAGEETNVTVTDVDLPSGHNEIGDKTSISGKNVRLHLTSGVTNYWNIPIGQLNGARGIGFEGSGPSNSTPLVINVIGGGTLSPEIVVNGGGGVSRNEALSSLLWNISEDVTLTGPGGRPLPGTFFAPGSDLVVNTTNNVEGQLIGKSLYVEALGEQHHHPFTAVVECGGGPGPSPTPTDSPTTTPSPTPTPTDSPSPSPTPTDSPSPSPTPTDSPTASPSPTPTHPSGPTPGPSATNTPAPPPGGDLANTGGALPPQAAVIAGIFLVTGVVFTGIEIARRKKGTRRS